MFDQRAMASDGSQGRKLERHGGTSVSVDGFDDALCADLSKLGFDNVKAGIDGIHNHEKSGRGGVRKCEGAKKRIRSQQSKNL